MNSYEILVIPRTSRGGGDGALLRTAVAWLQMEFLQSCDGDLPLVWRAPTALQGPWRAGSELLGITVIFLRIATNYFELLGFPKKCFRIYLGFY